MDDQTIKEILKEIAPLLIGRAPGRLFQLSPLSIAIDFRGKGNQFLFLSAEPAQPRLHLIGRRLRDLEKQSVAPSPFVLAVRNDLRGATLESIRKVAGERIVAFSFAGLDESGRAFTRMLVAQLTGRSANLFLLDDRGEIIQTLRSPRGTGQKIGAKFTPPAQAGSRTSVRLFEKGPLRLSRRPPTTTTKSLKLSVPSRRTWPLPALPCGGVSDTAKNSCRN